MQKRSQKTNRTDKVKNHGNRLVYKRTEIDDERGFDISKVYYPLVFISVVGILYLMFFSGVFNVNQINVKETKEIKPETIKEDVEKRLNGQLFEKNIFLFDKDSVTRELKKSYALKSIRIKKQYPTKLDVAVEEYILELQWLSGGKYYLIDEKGKAVVEQSGKKENIPVVEDKKNVPVGVGKSLVTLEFINFIKYLDKNFSETKRGKITKIEINESFNEINVYSDLGFYIIFDTTRDPSQELKNLVTVLSSKEVAGKKFGYFDMRIKNKVFYK
ncbi:MAG: FtsQ-type POTRA domain-containing protein [Patescibacteria group bacterium]